MPYEIICYHCQQTAERLLKDMEIINNFIKERIKSKNLMVDKLIIVESPAKSEYNKKIFRW